MQGKRAYLLVVTLLALFTFPLLSADKSESGNTDLALPNLQTPDPSRLTPVFMPPPFTMTRGVTVDTLQDAPPAQAEVIQEQDRVPCGGDRVAVDIFRPSQPGHYPVVILLHGTHGPGRAEKFYIRAAQELAKNGFVSLFLRYYDRGRKGKGNRNTWTQTIEDTLTFAAKLNFADPERMALLGFSQGAFLALNDAPSDPRIRAVVAYYGGLSPGYVPQAKLNMPPTLLFHGTADGIVPVKRSVQTLEWLRQEGRPADLVVYRGAGHGFLLNSNAGADQIAAEDSLFRTISFLNFHLRYPAWTPAVEPMENEAGQSLTVAGFNSEPEFFPQPPLRVIPYLQEPPESDWRSFTLVNPPSDEVFDIARSAPLKRWSHSHRSRVSKKGKAPAKHSSTVKKPAAKAPSKAAASKVSAAKPSNAKSAVAKPSAPKAGASKSAATKPPASKKKR